MKRALLEMDVEVIGAVTGFESGYGMRPEFAADWSMDQGRWTHEKLGCLDAPEDIAAGSMYRAGIGKGFMRRVFRDLLA